MINKAMRIPWISLPALMIAACLGLLVGCSTGGLTDATSAAATNTVTPPTDGGATSTPATIKLTASPVSVKSGNVETSTVTATVLDASNAAVKNLVVIFKASGGQISDTSAITDTSGKAQITFSSGTIDPSNGSVTITGTVTGITPSTVPVTVTGSTLIMSVDKTNLPSDGSVASTVTLTAKDGSGAAIYNTPVTFSVSGAGGVTLSKTSGTTDPLGQISLTVTGSTAGPVTLTASGLGTLATQSYTVSAVGALFAITVPADNPHSLSTNTDLTITANAPGVASVRFATTLGFLNGVANQQVVTIPVAGGVASVTLRSTLAGLSTVQAFGFQNLTDTTPSVNATLGVVISAPASAATSITLQPNVSSLAPSAGSIQNTTKVTATVLAGGQPVGNAPVAFSITNPTGGGETITPVVVYTDGSGRATTNFTSGSLPTDATGVIIQAQLVGLAIPPATAKIAIGGTPGSVAIGLGTDIFVNDPTTYSLPMVVTVADSTGAAVPGAVVSLSLWPIQYSSGSWYDSDPDPKAEKFVPYITGTFANEDTNEDMYRNLGEDVNLNGLLDPANSSAGTIPATVTTDANGAGHFSVFYPKQSAVWIVDRLRASVVVKGTETTSAATFRLPGERKEGEAGKLPDSNYFRRLVVAGIAGSTVSFVIPPFTSAFPVTYTPSLPASSVVGLTYTFTVPAGGLASGTVLTDTISVSSSGTYGTGSVGFLGTTVPVQIVVP